MRLAQRLRSVFRRDTDGGDVLRFSDLELCRRTRKVMRASRPIELTRTEFDLLEFFLANPGRVLERTEIAEHVWGFDFGAASNSMNVYIGYIRRKTESGGEPRLIHTVRGVGYVLRES
jgi:two-component system response regulator MprA